MSQLVEVKVPDIGDFSEVPIIELFVKVGDSIKAEDAICTLESDKATMDVPSPATGVDTQAWDYVKHYYDAHAFIPHTSRHTYPMIWCYCQMSAWQYPMFRNYAKYR